MRVVHEQGTAAITLQMSGVRVESVHESGDTNGHVDAEAVRTPPTALAFNDAAVRLAPASARPSALP